MHGRLSMSPISMASLSMSHEYLGFHHKGTRDIMK